MSSNNSYTDHLDAIEKYAKIRAGFLSRLRNEFGVSFRVLLNICLAFRSKFVFGSFFILQLSWSGYNRLKRLWWFLVRRAVGFSYLVPLKDTFDFLGLLDLEKFLVYWFSKFYFGLKKFDENTFDRIYSWENFDHSQNVENSRYNFRQSTKTKSSTTNRTVTNKFKPLQIYFAQKIKPIIGFISTMKGYFCLKSELKKMFATTRINKLFSDNIIKSRISELNDRWYTKKVASN